MKSAVICFCCVFSGGLVLMFWPGSQTGVREESAPSLSQDETAVVDFTDEIQRRWKILMDTPDSKGWKQTGEMQADLAQSMQDVEVLMKECGYVGRHSVGGPDAGYALVQYEAHGDKKVIWSLRRIDLKLTSFSWGWSE